MKKKGPPFSDKLILRDYLAENRTVQANERTLLAYIRTAITFLIAGITFIKFFDDYALRVTGFLFLPIGAYFIGKGFFSYRKMNELIARQREFFAAHGENTPEA